MLAFIYFTTITKQVKQLILTMLVGTDVCFPVVFVWEETGVPGGKPHVWLGDHMSIWRVAAVWGEYVTTTPARRVLLQFKDLISENMKILSK